ncbi:cupin-like domain-containing protein [Sphingobium sp. AR-3-1]|uniref:Cupin-like domain-containing protein n=1 Tax=Sphingobium psychrophilum TaxID=2728834 RepID=A0A7X9WXK7_9SPHN|nr:cupin-like domain-containing protein [Sphingobium psychrophilum]NML11383.1 cupin-like domain-containing protein [Sphingobium psychrophilum]
MSKRPPSLPAQAHDMRMQMALRQIDFGAAPRPATAAPKPQAPDDALALKRRDWLADVQERQRALSPYASGLLTAEHLSGEDFLHSFYAPGRPVLIKGAMAGWPALDLWTPDYLAETVGDAMIEFQGDRSRAADYELAKDRHKMRGRFRDFIAMVRHGGNNAYLTAYNSAANGPALAPLQADLGHLNAYLTRAPGMLWIGGEGTFTPLHFDLTNNMLAQVTGTKRVILIPPSQTRRLAHKAHVFSEVRDVTDEARLALYPQARDVLRYEVLLTPGDLLFVPIGWWHQVRLESFATMLTYTGFHWPNVGYEGYPAG